MSEVAFPPDFPWEDWSAYVAGVQHHLGLSHWNITLGLVPCPEDYQGTCECTFGRRHAHIEFCSWWERLTPAQQRETVVHELLHILFDPIDAAMDALEGVLTTGAFLFASRTHTRALEHTIDDLSRVIAEGVPLPSIPRSQYDAIVETPKS